MPIMKRRQYEAAFKAVLPFPGIRGKRSGFSGHSLRFVLTRSISSCPEYCQEELNIHILFLMLSVPFSSVSEPIVSSRLQPPGRTSI